MMREKPTLLTSDMGRVPPPDAGQQLAVSDDLGADADYGPFERLFGVGSARWPTRVVPEPNVLPGSSVG